MTESLHRVFATMATNTVEVQDEEGLRLYLDLFGSARAFWTGDDQTWTRVTARPSAMSWMKRCTHPGRRMQTRNPERRP